MPFVLSLEVVLFSEVALFLASKPYSVLYYIKHFSDKFMNYK